jgi:hypothetical protein
MSNFKRNDRVQIECDGQAVSGLVMLASENGKSLMLGFDGMLDGCLGMLPVLMGNDGKFYALMTGTLVKVTGR